MDDQSQPEARNTRTIAVNGGQSIEAAAALVKWFTDLGADVEGVNECGEGVDIHLSVGGRSLLRVLCWRSRHLARINRAWTQEVEAHCQATRRWLTDLNGASPARRAFAEKAHT